jgi:hypothetical protein
VRAFTGRDWLQTTRIFRYVATLRATSLRIRINIWFYLGLLSLLVIFLRLPSLELPFDNDNGVDAYHARLILGGEPLYGTHHPAHHLPGIYYTHVMAFLLFGDSLWAVKLFLMLWVIISLYLLYGLGLLLKDGVVGLLAGLFYAILSSHLLLLGQNAPLELFANTVRLAAILLLLVYLATRQALDWRLMWVGVLSACAFLFKAVYLSPLALAGFILLVEGWRNRSINVTLRRSLWLGFGFLLGLLPIIIYFGLLGLWPRLYLVFILGQRYVDASASMPYMVLYPLMGLAINNVLLLMFSLAGLVIIGVSGYRNYRGHPSQVTPTAYIVAAWYLLSLLEAGINRSPYPHYFLLLLPPLVLLAAWFVRITYLYLRNQSRPLYRFSLALSMTLLLALTLVISISQNFSYHAHYWRYKLGLESYENFLVKGWPADGPGLVRTLQLADYIQKHTSPSDQIYYWSDWVQLYYHANRRSAFDIVWPIFAADIGHYQQISALDSKYDIFNQSTKYIIIDQSTDKPPPSRPDWFNAALVEKYELETVLADQEIYRCLNCTESGQVSTNQDKP